MFFIEKHISTPGRKQLYTLNLDFRKLNSITGWSHVCTGRRSLRNTGYRSIRYHSSWFHFWHTGFEVPLSLGMLHVADPTECPVERGVCGLELALGAR